MCGILFQLENDRLPRELQESHVLKDRVTRRGPDSSNVIHAQYHELTLSFTSSVLHLRGTEIVQQPLVASSGNILCWNGEVWDGYDINVDQNDSLVVFQALIKSEAPWKVLSRIKGPFAFVYFEAQAGKLWYGRDILGRRSLLSKSGAVFTLSSVADARHESWLEVACDGIYCLELSTSRTKCFSWSETPEVKQLLKPWGQVNSSQPVSDRVPEDEFVQASIGLYHLLIAAISVRARTLPPLYQPMQSRIAVMYSGGLDCAVIARLLHDILPPGEPVDLLNVSFENPRAIANAITSKMNYDTYSTPDRLTGRQGYQELMTTCIRPWRFVEINVSYAQTLVVKDEVLDLMYPNTSVLDYSIALAFYFCGKGDGTTAGQEYHCPARVYFSGIGADEQLGGYSRHATAFRHGGHEQLIKELQLDLDRIPTRNLGRDDRILSHHGREVRWPYLDENVIRYLSALPVEQKMALDVPGGDKAILRVIGHALNIPKAAAEKKRAIQFGSRSARMEVEPKGRRKVKGHDAI